MFEHITTADAVQFVEASGEHVAATVTAHHLLYNRNDMLVGGFGLTFLLTGAETRSAPIGAAPGGDIRPPALLPRHGLGPHIRGEGVELGCAGCYTAHAALELYAEVFDEENALDRLEAFASFNGQTFIAYRATAARSR